MHTNKQDGQVSDEEKDTTDADVVEIWVILYVQMHIWK